MSPLKILVFTTAYPNNVWPNHGVFVKERITALSSLPDCEVRVVAPVPYYPPIGGGPRRKYASVVTQEEIDGIRVYHPRYLMTPKFGMSLYGIEMYLGALLTVRRIRREFDFDIVSGHTVYPDGMGAVLIARHFGKPAVVSARGTDINYLPRIRIVRGLIRWTLKNACRSMAVCQALKDEMMALGAQQEDVDVVSNGVDAVKFRPVPTAEARKFLGLPERRTLVSVGELIPRKGFHLLIEALHLLKKDAAYDDLCLIIAGEGRFRTELEQLVADLDLSDSVRFIGAVPHSELFMWYSAADLFCLFSDREGWPNVIMEAMACGKPVVATPIWGIPEIVSDERYGILSDRTPGAIAESLREALARSWDTSQIVKFARANSWENVAKQMLVTLRKSMVSE